MTDEELYRAIEQLYAATCDPETGLFYHKQRTRVEWTEELESEVVHGLKRFGPKWRSISEMMNWTVSEDSIRNRVLRWNEDEVDDEVRDIVLCLHKERRERALRKAIKS